jgi:KDEL-tailed cysteine endopeptidase
VQQVVDCGDIAGTYGCYGGLIDLAFDYIQIAGGLETEANYPYIGKDQKCLVDKTKFEAVKITGYTNVKPNDCNQLEVAIAKQPVSVSIAAQSMQFYKNGVYQNFFCGTGINHGVVAVGYGHDATVKKDFWIVKNSWGAGWGENGYIRMDREKNSFHGICGICMSASYPHVSSP